MVKKASPPVRKAARANYDKVAKTSKAGSGKRFAAVEKVSKAAGAENPAAVAAAKYGSNKFAEMGAKGRKKASKKGK